MVAICIAKRNVFMLFYDNSNAMICKDSLLVDVATICYNSHEDIWDLKEKEYYMDEELQVRYLDSCYEELTTINNRNHVILVKHKETGELRIKKILTRYDINLYKRLIDNPIAGVPQIYEFFQIDKGLIVIEEYVNGKTLDELLNRDGPMSENYVFHVFTALAVILKNLHSMNPPVIHRDIKPSNLMITKDGAVYLIDFNAAREFNIGNNKDTKLMGTQEFAAPEQYGFAQSDERTDQYGLGVTINVLLTGDFPRNHITQGVYKPIILRLTQLDPMLRYKSMEDVIHELNRLRGHFKKGTLGAGAEHFMEPYHSYDGTWKRFLPVGFRTCRIWKMAPAFLGYMFLLYSCVLMEMDGLPENKPWMLTVLRIMCFMMLIFNVFYIGNYLGIRYKLPGTKVNIGIHILLNIIYLILINFFIVMCMSMFVSMFSL